MTTVRVVLEGLCAAYRRGSTLALLFDYDGTLTPIAACPSLAVLDNHTRRLLASLADRPRVSLGILSGRQLDELKALVRLPGLYLAGTGGLELDLGGTRVEHPQAERVAALIVRLAVRLEKEVAVYQGAWLERKRLGLAVHYRQLPEHEVAPLRANVENAARAFGSELRIVQGPEAWEITPAWGWTKGTAVRLILAHLGANSPVLFYAGDRDSDIEAMEVVAAMGGIAMGIGPHAPSAAGCQLPDPGALRAFLANLDASLEEWKSSPARSCGGPSARRGSWSPALSSGST
jgi:trehalose 6-phosphate phosphatase